MDSRAKGTIIDFVAIMERINFQDAATKLAAICEVEAQRSCDEPPVQSLRCSQCSDLDTRTLNRPLTHTLSLDPTHAYLAERGLTSEIVEQFGLGYCDRGLMRGRICIPIHDAEGNLVAYAGRWASNTIPNSIPRYLLSKAFRKRNVLFNLHRIGRGDHIALVEGYWSVFRLHSFGIPVLPFNGWAALAFERGFRR